MAINVYTLNKPWIWVEATTGGSLTAATYYFIGFFNFADVSYYGSYYGFAPGTVSDQVSVTTDATNNRIKMEIYELGGYISAYADTGDSTHVTVTTTVAHGMSNGDTVYIRGSANYTGAYTVSSVAATSFDIVATWVSDDGASNWYKTPGLPAKPTAYAGDVYFMYKWDYYSMLRGDGSYFQWCNTNDPAFSDEWAPASGASTGHRRWMNAYYYAGLIEGNFTTGADGSKYLLLSSVSAGTTGPGPSTTIMYEGTGGSAVNGGVVHPQISLRKYDAATATSADKHYQLPEGMDENAPAVLILVDNSDGNNSWFYMATAIDAYEGGSIIISKNGYIPDSTAYQYARDTLMVRGIIGLQNVTSWTSQPTWYDKNIILIHGRISKVSGQININTVPVLVGCVIWYSPLHGSYWVNPTLYAPNSMVISNGSNLILDNVYTDNTTVVCPSSFINYYVSNDGTNFQGTKARENNFSQVMRNNTDGQYVRNSKFIWTVCVKDDGNITPKTFEMTNVEFKSPQSDDANPASVYFYNCDFYCRFNGLTTASVVVDVYNWTNCTSPDRADKIIRCKFGNQGITSFPVSTDSTMNHNFFYDIELTVTDEAGNKIENATVSVANSKATPDVYSGDTDVNGYIKLTPKCYDIVIDPDNADGYTNGGSTRKFYSKTTLFNDITLTISKSGYETYTGVIEGVLEAQDMTIALKPAGIQTDQEQAIQI